jgi:hypothetical protein
MNKQQLIDAFIAALQPNNRSRSAPLLAALIDFINFVPEGTPANIADYQLRSEKGQPGGYAPLDTTGVLALALMRRLIADSKTESDTETWSIDRIKAHSQSVTRTDHAVQTIAQRNALADNDAVADQESVFVEDATGDPTVEDGWAIYRWFAQTETWLKITAGEDLDIDLSQYLKLIDVGEAFEYYQGEEQKLVNMLTLREVLFGYDEAAGAQWVDEENIEMPLDSFGGAYKYVFGSSAGGNNLTEPVLNIRFPFAYIGSRSKLRLFLRKSTTNTGPIQINLVQISDSQGNPVTINRNTHARITGGLIIPAHAGTGTVYVLEIDFVDGGEVLVSAGSSFWAFGKLEIVGTGGPGTKETTAYVTTSNGTVDANLADIIYANANVTSSAFSLTVQNPKRGTKVNWTITKNGSGDLTLNLPSGTKKIGNNVLQGAVGDKWHVTLLCDNVVGGNPEYSVIINGPFL